MRRRLVALAAATLLLTACTGKDDSDVKTAKTTDVTATVNDYASKTAELVAPGAPLLEPETNPSPCEGKLGELSEEVQSVLGAYQVELPVEQHHTALQRIRDTLHGQGFEVREDRDLGNGEGQLTVHNPADGYTIMLQSTKPPSRLALIITSPCYRVAPA